jgi:hypothetical protein
VLGPHPAAGQPGQHLGVTLAADQRLQHAADRQRVQLAGTAETLIRASSSSFSSRE